METNKLLDNFVSSNVHRVNSVGRVQKHFPKEYPDLLRGLMKESVYVDYLERIEEAARISMLLVVLVISPVVLVIPVPIIIAVGKYVVGIMYLVFWISYTISILVFSIILARIMVKRAKLRVDVVIEDINQKYNSRGVRWAYVPGTRGSKTHIDITLFNPNSVDKAYIPAGASSINSGGFSSAAGDGSSSFYRTFSSESTQMTSHEEGTPSTFETYPGGTAMGAIID